MTGSLLALAITFLTLPVAAQGHDGRHDFESLIRGIVPVNLARGIEVRMIDYDERVELINDSGETVIVTGYEGEPYARIESRGPVYLNLRSPSLAPSNDRWGRTPATGNEDATAPPHWVEVGNNGRLAWFDRRSHYRGPGTPADVTDSTQRQQLWDYRIPLRIGEDQAAITGTLFWAGRQPFPVVAFVVMLLATAACAFFGVWAMRRVRGEAGRSPRSEGRPPRAARYSTDDRI